MKEVMTTVSLYRCTPIKPNEAVSKAIKQHYDGNGKLYEDEFYQLILPSTV